MGRVRPDIWISFFLVLLTVAAFAPVFGSDFVNYDDPDYVTHNPHVRAGLTSAGLSWAWKTNLTGNWHPLTWMSLQLDAQLYGLNPTGFHLTNLLLHVANTVLLFWALLRLTGARGPSALVAALFAVHPLHVEAVAWVSERKELLSALFGMLMLMAYSDYVQKPGVRSYLLVAGALALGLLAKPMLVTMPFVLLLLDYWPLGRLSLAGVAHVPGADAPRLADALPRYSFRELLVEKLPLLALSAASCVMTVIAQKKSGALGSLESLPVWARCANALVSYVRYLGATFWPIELTPYYPHAGQDIPLWQPAVAILLLAGITLLVLRYGRRLPFLPAGWFWYLGTLIPVIGLVQVGSQARADRYTYLPLIGIFIMLAWGLAVAGVRLRVQVVAGGLVSSIIGACLIGTLIQAGRWHDSVTLWTYTLQVNPSNAVAQLNLGTALEERNDITEAERLYRETLRVDPASWRAHVNLGRLLGETGSLDEATEHFKAALRLAPDKVLPHTRFAVFLEKQGKLQEAVQQFQEAVRLDPDFGPAHRSQSSLFGRLGQVQRAIFHSLEALRIDPQDAVAHVNLGVAFEGAGRLDRAIEHFRTALRLDSNNAEAHSNLGAVLDRQGNVGDAENEYREAVRFDPQYVLARTNLGSALERLGRPQDALEQYREAVRLQPKQAQDYAELARGFMRLGQKEEAVECFRQAVKRQPQKVNYHLGLASALQKQGDEKGAEVEYQETLRLDPQWPENFNQAAWTFATRADPRQRNGAMAVALAQQVCQATHHRDPRFVDTLATAYASAGQYSQAVAAARQALTLASAAQQTELAKQIQTRLRLYENNQPYVAGGESRP